MHEFSAPITPKQNEIVKRKNRTLQEMAHVMLNPKKLTRCLWAKHLILHVILLTTCIYIQTLRKLLMNYEKVRKVI